MTLTSVPHGRTARRLEWPFLPPHVRDLVEQHCGSPVVGTRSMNSGFTPGFASVLTCADGSQHFVKAASVVAQRVFADAYREEGRRLAALPASVPAPRLLWSHDEDWVVLGIEHVEHTTPPRPWRGADLERVVAALEAAATALTPPPAGPALVPLAEEVADWPSYWDLVRLQELGRGLDVPGLTEHLHEAAELAALAPVVAAGDTLVHMDVRDDNVLLAADGRVLLCDWNWPVRGAAWFDTVALMIGPHGDGIDVDAVLARSPLTRDVPADHIDAVLALHAGYFLLMQAQRVPPTSPFLRTAQRWNAEVTWDLLAQRRGWP
ncbi:hypothetical protein GGQ22_19480 [Nocardioides sp. zg-579]|uniref:Phosphotransferase n=1 Tax=Nocardioides marmotae TaxID=2663857 RepID=A0A6I3JG57_9ACTN|nr:hypothetical protein [Nocardioides marmotae]MCR6033596.1 hypothetical protein [Gordonia jinghuaiqii]MTB97254.1 hypothetical protein [Nocardioides marmotae]QKE02168.1 hypothetical protein HPC71_14600 [Nocardioides marmotae]